MLHCHSSRMIDKHFWMFDLLLSCYFILYLFLTTLLGTVACHVTRISLFGMALCYEERVTIKTL